MRLSDRRALLILFVAFIGVWSAVLIFDHFIDNESTVPTDAGAAIQSLESQLTPDSGRHQTRPGQFRQAGHAQTTYYAQPAQPVETFPFDPNTADSTDLLRLGLPSWMVRNIYRYRAKGGRYHKPDDFKRTYGMTGELWKRLGPMVRIADDFRLLSETAQVPSNRADSSRRDTARSTATELRYPEKFKEVVQLDLNKADTNLLRRIPGIGPVYARRIVRYREQLGGFATLSQLSEIPDLPEGIEQWFAPPTTVTRVIDVNKADFKTLRRHPYMSYKKAVSIDDQRRIYGPIKSLDELRHLPGFTEADLQKLAPYLRF